MPATDPALFKALTEQYQGKGKGHLEIGRGTVVCEQCRLLKINDAVMNARVAVQRGLVNALVGAPRPTIRSESSATTLPVNLLTRCIASGKDVSNEGLKLLAQAYGKRSRTVGPIEGEKVARAFDLMEPAIEYDHLVMDSSAVTRHMTAGGKKFDDRDLVALEPRHWHDKEFQIGKHLGLGAGLLVVQWTDGKDSAIMAENVLRHVSSWTVAAAEKAIRMVTEKKEQGRGGGAFGHLRTGGVLTPEMRAAVKQNGGVLLPLKGYSMKYVYMSSVHKRKLGGRTKTGYVRESPHHVTNQRKTWTLRTQQAVATARQSEATRLVFLARAGALLKMSIVAESAGIPVMDRSVGFYICLGRVLADKDPFADMKLLSLKERALLYWWGLDSTESSRGISHWTAACPISGHFDKQHRAEVMFPCRQRESEPGNMTTRTILPRRNASYALQVDSDQALTWLQSVHLSDRSRGISTAMTIVSV